MEKKFGKFGKKRKNNGKFSIAVDTLRGLAITLLVFIFIVFFASSVVHNLLRVGEVSSKYTGKYKNLCAVGNNKMMNIYSVGNGERTIVILPEYATESPVIKYKALADSLSSEYKVVIVEYLGYGFSLSTKEERTNAKIVGELRNGLKDADIYGPYILMPFSTSNVYANYYSKNYPEEIGGIISIDGIYAESIENDNFEEDYLSNLIFNVKFYSALSFSGVFRWGTYLKPEKFNIDKMSNNSSYGKEEIKLYRNLLSNKFLTESMKNEIKKLKDNMKEIVDYKYSAVLPTLQILTSNNIDTYKKRNENLKTYAENLITNDQIQKIKVLDGELSDYLFDSEMIKQLKNVIRVYF